VEAEYPPPFTETSHCQEYVDDPVAGMLSVTVIAWSRSRAVTDTVGASAAVRVDLTVTVVEAVEV
jgi:hypothetical protein